MQDMQKWSQIKEFCGSMKWNSKAGAVQGKSVDGKVAMMG